VAAVAAGESGLSEFIAISCSLRKAFTRSGQVGAVNFPVFSKSGRPPLLRGRALTNKLIVIAVIGLLLLVPLQLVRSTLHERSMRHDAALDEVASVWGRSQQLTGPILAIPYTYPTRDDGTGRAGGMLYLLPESLVIDGDLEPKDLRRGIFTAQVFRATLRLTGRFAVPTAFTAISNVTPLWAEARLVVAISDVRRMRASPTLAWNGENLAWDAGSTIPGLDGELQSPVRLQPEMAEATFDIALVVDGSGAFQAAPIGRETTLTLRSTWPSPRFGGASLPTERDVRAEGFTATWHASPFGREFPSRWTQRGDDTKSVLQAMQRAAFDVELVPTVTAYRTIERSIKYGVLFIAMVFAMFFLFEVVCRARLHALNYILVGAALCLFYLTLLALAEFIGFTWAYVAATAASLVMIALYAWRILRSGARAALVAALLSGVYGYLFFVLRMEDFALLAGTAALFVTLSAVMYFTRNLDGQPEEEKVAEMQPEATS
jgi:inner membrane protein